VVESGCVIKMNAAARVVTGKKKSFIARATGGYGDPAP